MNIKRMLLLLPLMTVLALGFVAALGADIAVASGDACFVCHGIKATAPSQTIAGKTVSLWVDPVAYAASKHGAQECTVCHGSESEAHDKTKRTYGGWARFSVSTSTDTSGTWNFWKVPGDRCMICHTSPSYAKFSTSDHATGWNMAHTPDGANRKVVDIVGSDGVTYHADENYTEADCGRCHMGNNCAPCHWKTAIINNPKNTATGGITSILDLWTDYSAAATAKKSALCENAIDWTQNIATHDFRPKTELTSSNTVCVACHGGYLATPDASKPAIKIFGPGYSRHGQSEELQRSGARGVHETLQRCTDCHKAVHDVKSPESMLQWRQNPDVTCIGCHPTRKITGVGVPHQRVSCLACHATGVDAILDPNGGGTGVPLIIPRVIKHLVQQGWASHDLRRDTDCSRCHVDGGNQTGAPAMSKITAINPHATGAPSPLMPVWRFYNFRTGTHFYTADPAEMANVQNNMKSVYSLDGVCYTVNTANTANSTILYRFYNMKTGSHFYTADPAEKTRIESTMGSTYRLDGPAYSVASTNVAGATTVWRFYNMKTGTHFYTADTVERDRVLNTMKSIYSLDGPAYYLAP